MQCECEDDVIPVKHRRGFSFNFKSARDALMGDACPDAWWQASIIRRSGSRIVWDCDDSCCGHSCSKGLLHY